MLHSAPDNEQAVILVVDDEPTNVAVLMRLLAWAGYKNLHSAEDGEQAIAAIASLKPDLVILDLHMPGKDGYEVLEEVRAHRDGAFLPIVAYTADVTKEARERALTLGATDFLTKPGERTEIKLRVNNLLAMRFMHRELSDQNAALDAKVRERTRELEEAQAEIVERLARAGEFRDEDTGAHTLRVGEIAAAIALRLGLDAGTVGLIGVAARLHDIGKIGVSDQILLKPGELSAEERTAMQQHTGVGAKILADGRTPLLKMAERIALTHHERWDGGGYPNGLAGEAIPIEGRIVAVADVYDALTHERPYKRAWSEGEALREIMAGAGSQFDPRVVEALLDELGERRKAA